MNDPDAISEIEEVLAAAYHQAMAIDPRMRRFSRALADLGMPVPAEWATTDGEGTVEFAPISWKAFDRLVCLLEDIAGGRRVHVTVVQGGPTLFGPATPPGPMPAPAGSSIHLTVPR